MSALGQNRTCAAHKLMSALPSKATSNATYGILPINLYFEALAFRYASLGKSTNIESDLLWVLHVKKALLGKFACEVWIDLPERGDGSLSFIRPLQMPQGSNPV